ncbi:hypothetical protein [Rhodobacter maris]|uniref:Uncharacterized protein n=1 Tax=Rhodobacter maris TaxID=446682 RepID=A0A285SL91_9RHOB|nr:hypothetical protein [Rhodobacter maris]SOC08110.1 hypothetical protein SAMN05877831_106147 [Rhodobacter maris]
MPTGLAESYRELSLIWGLAQDRILAPLAIVLALGLAVAIDPQIETLIKTTPAPAYQL